MELITEYPSLQNARFLGAWADDSEEWHKAREEFGVITGSVIGSICGLNPWESPATRWFKAMGRISNEIPVSMSMKLGKTLEQPLLDLLASEHPEWTIYRTGTWESVYEPWARANPDGLFVDENGELCLIEVKFSRSYWNGQLPLHYRAQVMWYLGVLGLKKAVVVGLVDSAYTEIEILFDDFEWEVLRTKAIEFRALLDADTPPEWDGAENTYETAKALHPEIEDREEEIAEQLGIDLVNTANEIDELTYKLNELKSRTLDQMGSAKTAVIGTTEGRFVVANRSARKGGTPFLTIKKGNK